ncbi:MULTISPECIES: MFS transporter [unclassified Pseudomonas]|uniref:MFS transporter n=1 Tax=unclassified Pseudomonas TaxID=196821 RepID=UPI000C86D1AA|nr:MULTISPECIES: MFS transporter [unclassified Pseudomonas]PMV83608.1 MFS transporter [Pseudomonas sp. GW101-1A09]PMV93751.1 MFS transporter [Pseudomonas sp. FW306-2-2C-B10A]PMV97704.1 MFS transporter [Pseudomonas sp. GW460-C8]PMW01783.1 MFS transporter [Pseudomonas sp. MPR-TSA4]PMW10025.1 MFS transporter [Pseudomonas sp. GW456-11-11-14-TSB2]
MANPYRELLTTPGVMGLVIASSIARLPQAMIGIGIITMLVQQTGLYWLAGSVAGTFTLANALIGPQVSKLVDQRGQSRVLPLVTTFSIGMLLALIVAVSMRAPTPLLFILAALAGTMPSMPAMIRARWTQLFRGKPQLHTAFSLDTVLTELAFIIGPPLAIGLSVSFFAEAGPLVAVLLLVIGVSAFLLQKQTEPKVIVGVRKSTGSTLLIPGVRTIVLALLAMGVIGGSIDVAVVAFANAQDWPASASFILAAYALGSMIAGLTFGALRVSLSIEKQFFVGVLITAVTAVLPIFSPDVYILSGMLFVAGMSFAPTMVVVMNLGTIIVPPSRITEGLTWMTTGISIGVALGGVLAGLVIDAYGARAGFGVAIGAGLVMVVIVLLGLRTLRSTSAVCAEPSFQ